MFKVLPVSFYNFHRNPETLWRIQRLDTSVGTSLYDSLNKCQWVDPSQVRPQFLSPQTD